MPELGKILVFAGLAVVLLGVLIWSGIGFFGRLPGDIRIARGHSVFYFPLATCIVVSIILSLVLSLFRR